MLIWKLPKPGVAEFIPFTTKQGFNWDAWYAKNKVRLSEKRAKRYREDAAYRAAAMERSRLQRDSKKPEPVSTDPHTVAFTDAADNVGVTVWVLREWRRKNYFPEPYRREGRMWFSPQQVQLLHHLKHLFDTYGTRVTDAFRPELEAIVSLTYMNWN